jgi:gliding motility-associated lipoprotein GldH
MIDLNMQKIATFQSILVLILFLLACDSNRLYEDNKSIQGKGWSQEDDMNFTFNIEDTLSFYSVFVNVRNRNDYRYSNLYLFVEMVSPSNKFFLDTIALTLAEPNGKWIGSGVGNIWQIQYPLLDGVRLLESGQYSIKINQGMRDDTLVGISDVGVRVQFDNE